MKCLINKILDKSCSKFTKKISEQSLMVLFSQLCVKLVITPITTKQKLSIVLFLDGVISGPYFSVFGLNTGKYRPEITSHLDTLHAGDVMALCETTFCF